MNDIPSEKTPRYWAMDGVFPGDFELWRGDQWANQKRFVADKGFHGSGFSVHDLDDAGRVSLLRELGETHGQRYAVHIGVDYRESGTEGRARLLGWAQSILAHHALQPLMHVTVVVKGGGHRFDRHVPLTRQFDSLKAQLIPFVESCRASGLPVAIENHGDYYLSDLVDLCGMVPGLEIQLDTGNCFLIGERPDLIADAVFPLVRSTHWKDHYVQPNPKTLHFELTGATLGQGHVGLERIYERLLRLHPDPASICMRVEWVPDPVRTALECFAQSLAYLENLSRGRFTASRK